MKAFLFREFWWAMHNVLAHPLSQVTWWLSLCGTIKAVAAFGDWMHDWTVPVENPPSAIDGKNS